MLKCTGEGPKVHAYAFHRARPRQVLRAGCAFRDRSLCAPAESPPGRCPGQDGSCRCRPSQKHNAHGIDIIKVHYPFHPLHGQSFRVQRRAKLPNGEYIFCELPDGSIGGFPSWIADPTEIPDFTLGPVLTSAAALTELWTLLDSLHSNSQRGIASLKEMRREDTNDTKENDGDNTDEPTIL
jgi:hypothetical protein